MPYLTLTWDEWSNTHADYRGIDPNDHIARVLRLEKGATIAVPVVVTPAEPGGRLGDGLRRSNDILQGKDQRVKDDADLQARIKQARIKGTQDRLHVIEGAVLNIENRLPDKPRRKNAHLADVEREITKRLKDELQKIAGDLTEEYTARINLLNS